MTPLRAALGLSGASPRLAAALLLAAALRGCLTYEYEHEFWLQVDGSGTVNVTGRPALWTAFKSLPLDESDPEAMKKAARELFERSGHRVKRITVFLPPPDLLLRRAI